MEAEVATSQPATRAMGRPLRAWPDEQLARLKAAVESGLPFASIRARFKLSHHTLTDFVKRYEWKAPHAERSRKKAFVLPKFRSQTGQPIEDRKLYGAIVDDVQFLRRRGYDVFIRSGGYQVGNALLDSTELQEKAARERRLSRAFV